MQLKVLDTGSASAEQNMLLDSELLESLGSEPVLHFYEWEKESISHGYFIVPGKFLDLNQVAMQDIDLARRPTGGGVVFHLWDFAFSVLIPSSSPHFSLNTLDNYDFINQAVLQAVQEFLGRGEKLELISQDAGAWDLSCHSFCMAKPTKYDLVLEGRKIAGAAQRKRKQGFLHQGTIALVMPPEERLRGLLLPEGKVADAILAHTYPLLGNHASTLQIEEAKRQLRELLQKSLTQNMENVLNFPVT